MSRYYVESGEYKAVVRAEGAIVAAAKALSWVTPEDRLESKVTVSRRGFPSRRRSVRVEDSLVLETGSLFALLADGEL